MFWDRRFVPFDALLPAHVFPVFFFRARLYMLNCTHPCIWQQPSMISKLINLKALVQALWLEIFNTTITRNIRATYLKKLFHALTSKCRNCHCIQILIELFKYQS